jgi:iron complex outermembrane receptor protein
VSRARSTHTALALAVAAALSAQARADDAATAAPDAASATQQLGRVEVVGSRIKRVDIETSQPVLVLERADLERTGLATVGDILQQIVVNGSNASARINNGNDGQVRVSLRNLGPNRTLVLLNGRRWVPELDGAVDLSTIPLPIVERIEVLRDGASAIYGSDAIAGVINITTRKNTTGPRRTRTSASGNRATAGPTPPTSPSAPAATRPTSRSKSRTRSRNRCSRATARSPRCRYTACP